MASSERDIIVDRPEDFDSFWQETLQEATQTPRDLQVISDTLRSNEEAEIFQVHFRSLGGVRIFGWYGYPNEDGPFSAILLIPGYGSFDWPPRGWAREGFAAFILQPRGHMGSDIDYKPGFPGLLADGLDSPYHYGYRGIYADCWLAMQFLLNRPEVDKARIATTGRSQGGALSLVTAALCPEVAAVATDVPFLTAIRSAFEFVDGYAFAEITDYLRAYPEQSQQVWKTLSYFDTMNFAEKVTCPVLMSLGGRDSHCPPVTVRALYEALSGPKILHEYPEAGHEGGGLTHDELKLAWLKEQLLGDEVAG